MEISKFESKIIANVLCTNIKYFNTILFTVNNIETNYNIISIITYALQQNCWYLVKDCNEHYIETV